MLRTVLNLLLSCKKGDNVEDIASRFLVVTSYTSRILPMTAGHKNADYLRAAERQKVRRRNATAAARRAYTGTTTSSLASHVALRRAVAVK